MNVLAINCGSSTLKFRLFDIEEEGTGSSSERRLAGGVVDGIAGRAAIDFAAENGQGIRNETAVADYEEATRLVLDWLAVLEIRGFDGPQAVGHRVVHGGHRFVGPTRIDDEVVDAIEALSDLAPLHNAPSLCAIRATKAALGPGVPMVATFDTAFHRAMPERASRYAIPFELSEKHRVYRYGFHGLAHRYMAEHYASVNSRDPAQLKLVTLQLGNGCSAAAVDGGRSIDTSMGFTPLEGLVMGTRSGDIDPSVVPYVALREGVAHDEVQGWLNTKSGLLGVSGGSSDVRELLEAEVQGEERAALALDMFCYRARKYVGAFLAALGGADAVVFGGGIGENSPAIRARICEGMGWCGLMLDPARNEAVVGSDGRISPDDSAIDAYVVQVDEEALIARDTVQCLGG